MAMHVQAAESLRVTSAFLCGAASWCVLFNWGTGQFHSEMGVWYLSVIALVFAGLIGGFGPIKEWFAAPFFAASGAVLTQLVITLRFMTTRDTEIIPLIILAMVQTVVIVTPSTLVGSVLYQWSQPRPGPR